MRGLNLEGSGKELVKFDQVRSHVGEQHSLNNDDVVLEMDKLRITPELNMEVPKMGTFVMTDWAKKQLGSILGVQWDKWFNPKHVDHKRIQEEIQHRFSKTGDTRKLRTRRFRSGSPGAMGICGRSLVRRTTPLMMTGSSTAWRRPTARRSASCSSCRTT